MNRREERMPLGIAGGPGPRIMAAEAGSGQAQLRRRRPSTAGTPVDDVEKRLLILEDLLASEGTTPEQLVAVRHELAALAREFRKRLPGSASYGNLFMHAPEPYLITEASGRIANANLECRRFLNLPIGTLQHRSLAAFITDAVKRRELRRRLKAMIPSERLEIEAEIRPFAVQPRYVSLSGTMIIEPRREPSILWLIRDLTFRQQVEQQLRENSARLETVVQQRTADLEQALESLRRISSAKDEFLALVSHELKTPLTVISGYTNFLRRHEDSVDMETRRMILVDIDQQAHRLESLLNNLMALARLDPNSSRDLEPVALQHVIRDAVNSARGRFPLLKVRLSVPPGLPPVYGLETYISQILENLLNNAQKYGGERVDICARANRGDVLVSVRDYGPGIRPEIAQRVFEPFFRGEVKDGTPGTGIGLSVCRRLVEAQEGELAMTKPAGRGTRFVFALRAITENTE